MWFNFRLTGVKGKALTLHITNAGAWGVGTQRVCLLDVLHDD